MQLNIKDIADTGFYGENQNNTAYRRQEKNKATIDTMLEIGVIRP